VTVKCLVSRLKIGTTGSLGLGEQTEGARRRLCGSGEACSLTADRFSQPLQLCGQLNKCIRRTLKPPPSTVPAAR
jgi:hypothetical protein